MYDISNYDRAKIARLFKSYNSESIKIPKKFCQYLRVLKMTLLKFLMKVKI